MTVIKNNKLVNEESKIDYNTLRQAVLTLRAINHPLRKKIIQLLDESKKMTVTDLFVKLRVEQSVASQHLALLRKAGILHTQRDGKFIYYSLNHERLNDIADMVDDLAQ